MVITVQKRLWDASADSGIRQSCEHRACVAETVELVLGQETGIWSYEHHVHLITWIEKQNCGNRSFCWDKLEALKKLNLWDDYLLCYFS